MSHGNNRGRFHSRAIVGRKQVVKCDTLTDAVKQAFADHAVQVEMVLAEASEIMAREAAEALAQAGDFSNRRGRYRRSFTYAKRGDAVGRADMAGNRTLVNDAFIVYSENEYRLTHLLENGHLTREGTRRVTEGDNFTARVRKGKDKTPLKERTQAFPHWQAAEDYVAANFTDRVATMLEAIE